MDASRFDDLTRTIGEVTTRRGALRFLSGAALGLGMGAQGPFASARACSLVGERCGKRKGRCCGDASCRKGRSGVGVCVCPQNRTNCGGYCVDIRSNPNACGVTCAQCPPETDCCNGVCCPEGQRCCGGNRSDGGR